MTVTCKKFFAVLLSLVLDGFDQLIKLIMHCPFLLSINSATSRKILETPRFEPGPPGCKA